MTEWLLIAGMMLVTFLPRYLPFAFVDKLKLPNWLLDCLPFVPIAVLTAIVSQTVMFDQGELLFAWSNTKLLATIVAMTVAFATKSLWWTVGLGLAAFYVLNFV